MNTSRRNCNLGTPAGKVMLQIYIHIRVILCSECTQVINILFDYSAKLKSVHIISLGSSAKKSDTNDCRIQSLYRRQAISKE